MLVERFTITSLSSTLLDSVPETHSWEEWQKKPLPQTKEGMSPTYDHLHKNTAVKKNGEIHLGMLPFITPFALLDENVDGQQITSLIYEDVNVNHNTIRPAMAYEICNNTDDYEANNVVQHSSGHEVDISKEFQLVFWNNDKVNSFSVTSINITAPLAYFPFQLCDSNMSLHIV